MHPFSNHTKDISSITCRTASLKHSASFALAAAALFGSLLLSSCEAKKISPELPAATAGFVSEDLAPGNIGTYYRFPMMETEKGYYFNLYRKSLNLVYYDKTTEKDIYLCSKPECQHDGNEYCAATNAAYKPLGMQLYSNHLLISAVSESEDKLEYKLLEAALDGSSLTELSTYFSHSDMGFSLPAFNHANSSSQFLLVHKNYAVLPLYLQKNEDFDAADCYGVVILDLNTNQIFSVYDETLSSENPKWTNIRAWGDYVYYVIEGNHKRSLHRYHLTQHTDESFELVTNFSGYYIPLDDDRILYERSKSSKKWLHLVSAGTNQEVEGIYKGADFVPSNLEFTLFEEGMSADELEQKVQEAIANDPDTRYEKKDNLYYMHLEDSIYTPSYAYFDGQYLYCLESRVYPTGGEICFSAFHVYDTDFKEITWVELPTYEEISGKEGPTDFGWDLNYYFLGDTIYINPSFSTLEYYKISRADFLAGNFDTLKEAFQIDTTRYNTYQ